MGKASYKIRETKNMRHFTYSGNLKDAIEKAKRDLQKEKENRAVPEITHRRWKELGLMKPLEPDQTAQYKFSDLQMSLYYTIYI